MNKKRIKKAIIPAAGYGTRMLPITKAIPKEMLPIGNVPAIHCVVEELANSGIEDILIVLSQDKTAIINYFNDDIKLNLLLDKKNKKELLEPLNTLKKRVKIQYIFQDVPNGLGDALLYGEAFSNGEPVAVVLPDDLLLDNSSDHEGIKQCIDCYEKNNKLVIGLMNVEQKNVSKYGIVKPVNQTLSPEIEMESIIEKPAIDKAPSTLAAIGRYILPPSIYSLIKDVGYSEWGEIELTEALNRCIKADGGFGVVLTGKRYDIGSRDGFIQVNVDLKKID